MRWRARGWKAWGARFVGSDGRENRAVPTLADVYSTSAIRASCCPINSTAPLPNVPRLGGKGKLARCMNGLVVSAVGGGVSGAWTWAAWAAGAAAGDGATGASWVIRPSHPGGNVALSP